MDYTHNLSSERFQVQASVDDIVSILECDTYSRKYITRMFYGKDYVTALDILHEEKIDAFSRLHAVLALNFLSELEKMHISFDCIESIIPILSSPNHKKIAESALLDLRMAVETGVLKDYKNFEKRLKETYESLAADKERIVFEALLKPFTVDFHSVPACVASCARILFGQDEESRLSAAKDQVNYLIDHLQRNPETYPALK